VTILVLLLQVVFLAGWLFFVVDAFRFQPVWVGFCCLCTPFWIYYGFAEYDGRFKWPILGASVGAQVISGGLVTAGL